MIGPRGFFFIDGDGITFVDLSGSMIRRRKCLRRAAIVAQKKDCLVVHLDRCVLLRHTITTNKTKTVV